MRRVIMVLAVVLALLGAFLVGGFRERLRQSLDKEAAYPWDLHRMIPDANLDCAKLLQRGDFFPWYVQRLKDGQVLVVARYDAATHTVSASAIDTLARSASDSWPLECEGLPAK